MLCLDYVSGVDYVSTFYLTHSNTPFGKIGVYFFTSVWRASLESELLGKNLGNPLECFLAHFADGIWLPCFSVYKSCICNFIISFNNYSNIYLKTSGEGYVGLL